MTKKILMVCKGEIPRSAIAEAVMKDFLTRSGIDNAWSIESALTNGTNLERADARARAVLKKHGLKAYGEAHRSRQIQQNDFEEFDYILGLDDDIMAELKRLAPPARKAKLLQLNTFGLEDTDRALLDPVHESSTEEHFERIFHQCTSACRAFLVLLMANEI